MNKRKAAQPKEGLSLSLVGRGCAISVGDQIDDSRQKRAGKHAEAESAELANLFEKLGHGILLYDR